MRQIFIRQNWILPCNCLPNFNELKSTLPRCAPQVLVFAGRGKEPFLLGVAGQTFSLPHGAGRRAVGRASLVETYFWHVYKTQHVQLYLAKPLGGRNIFLGRFCEWKHISGICIMSNNFNSILILVPNIWEWKHIPRMSIKPNIINFLPKFVPHIRGVETYF